MKIRSIKKKKPHRLRVNSIRKISKMERARRMLPPEDRTYVKNLLTNAVQNGLIARRDLLNEMFDDRRDIDEECGYPKTIDTDQYRYLYDREAIAARVVKLLPEESWTMDPVISEAEDSEETDWDTAWIELEKRLNLYHYMERVDCLSGIGRFGVILLGLSDGGALNTPAPGINERGEAVEGERENKLLYVRVFSESSLRVDKREDDMSNPRYGQPVEYSINFQKQEGEIDSSFSHKVHWSRVVHVADNRESSEIFGVPRMQVVYNRIYDIRKVLSGSGEMFWKGAFPGFAFETGSDIGDADIDLADIREAFEDYANGLQRYIATIGGSIKNLAPQVASPGPHIDAQLLLISIALGIPMRILRGSEQAKLASIQDVQTWNKRLAKRQNKYLTPLLVRPFVDRCIAVGALPVPAEGYEVEWEDLNTTTDEDRAKVAGETTKAMKDYVVGGVENLIPIPEYLSMVLGFEPDQVEAVMSSLDEFFQGKEEELNEVDDVTIPEIVGEED